MKRTTKGQKNTKTALIKAAKFAKKAGYSPMYETIKADLQARQ